LLLHRLFVIISCFLGIIITLNLLGIGGNADNKRRAAFRGGAKPSGFRAVGRANNPSFDSSVPHVVAIDLEKEDHADIVNDILAAQLNLVNILAPESSQVRFNDEENTYTGVYGDFCQLNFGAHKQDPSSVPMFRDLVAKSPDCSKTKYRVDLSQVASLARALDAEDGQSVTKSLELSGVVFHESRCGSTLVANALIGMNPAKHRVYSESAPPIAALRGVCGEEYQHCSENQAAILLQDTLYLMGRTHDLNEERVFFKIQSVGTRAISVFQQAYPQVPWMFVYRDPVQVLMSQLAQGSKNANCVRGRQQPANAITELVAREGFRVQSLSNVEYCAAHLASLTESAVAALERAPDMGVAVNYADLPHILYEDILPNKWNVPVSQEEQENIIQISGVYSKGRGNRAREWHEDSQQKEEHASPEIHKAADLFLSKSYKLLQGETNHDDAFR
jgi:hypothetical protein